MESIKKFNKFHLLELQEETGLGTTWRAAEMVNGKIDKYFLMDFISESLSGNDDFLDQFLNQSMITAKLEHPNILRQVTSLPENGKLATAYEYYEGFSLYRVLDRCNSEGFPLSIDHALLVTSKMLSALAYAKTKHMTHGFVNPSVVFVTHEGEIKVKGFALNSALRALPGLVADLESTYGNYVPKGMDYTSEDRDQLDIFGCGAILYEMLTGEPFNEGGGDAATRIGNAVTASEGESIPTQIANILVSALDPKAPSAYTDIQKMSKDMEDLLYSGEYSPTTFNLAFFMHSAFRVEMEELAEKISNEKEKNFLNTPVEEAKASPTAAAPVASATSAGVKGPPPGVTMPEPAAATVPAASGGRSKMPILIGVVVLLVVAAIGYTFMSGSAPEDGIDADKLAKDLEAERQAREMEELKRQNEELIKAQEIIAQEQARREKEIKAKQLEAEVKQIEEDLARMKAKEEQDQLQRKLQKQMQELERKKEEIDTLAKQQEKKEKELENLVEGKGPATATAKTATPAKDTRINEPKMTTPQPATTKKPQTQVASNAGTTSDTPLPVSPPEKTPSSDSPSGAGAEAGSPPKVDVTPPKIGELVDLNDPNLNKPVLLKPYNPQKVPKKAIRAGVVKRGRTLVFLMRLLVNENGKVDQAELVRNPLKPGESDYGMVDDAIEVAQDLYFSAPSKLGVPVKTWVYIGLPFKAN